MDKQKEFVKLCMDGDLEELKKININEIDIDFDNGKALLASIYNGHFDIVKYLHENGAKMSLVNDAAINWAISQDYSYIAKYVERAKEQEDFLNTLEMSRKDVSQEALDAIRKEVGYKSFPDIFIFSAEKGYLNIVEKIYEKGLSDIDVNDNEALVWASCHGQTKVVEYLLKNGANVNAKDDEAVALACAEGHLDTVELLVDNGADIIDNKKALRWAAEYGHLDVVDYLIKNKVDTSQSTRVLKDASKNGHLEVVKYLWKNDFRFTKDNNRPVERAIENGHWDVVKFFYDEKADFNDEVKKIVEDKFGPIKEENEEIEI